ncbi:MAG: hypothetical protein ACOYLX_19265 [Burkholderiaceae bacterium]
MLQVVQSVYAVAAFAMLLLVGQFLVRVMSFGRHEHNPVYRLFRFLTSPVVRLTRVITPARVIDAHVPVVAFLLLFWLCVLLGIEVIPKMAGVR